MKVSSISKQLLLNIFIPVIFGLLIIGTFSYRNTKTILNDNNKIEKDFIYDEIKSFIELQFVALSIIEEPMEKQMRTYSDKIVNTYFKSTENIENEDLNKIRDALGMDDQIFDLYVINQDGIIVNTTFKEDLYINFFSFGNAHKRYLINVFKNKKFDSPRFFFEHKTKRYKKYSYQATNDGKYVIEIGLYSTQADHIYDYMISHLDEIPKRKPNLIAVDMFFMADIPYPINLKREFIPEHEKLLDPLVKQGVISDSHINKKAANINYTYYFLVDKNPKIFNGTIIRIANDPTTQIKFIKKERLKIIIVLIISLLLVYFIIFIRSQSIVKPIKHLIDKSKIISNGNYHERVKVTGNNEIAQLSEQFNKMVNNIEERNNEIEEQSEFLFQANRKLNEAYKLLDHQKNLIENKQDDFTASLNYALRIQQSLLPQPDELSKIFPKSFIFMLPRDIVSGDFYWYSKIKNKVIIVAADCTGHGVPGAFMSMIGITILHHLVNYEHITDPELLLTRLDTEICDLLKFNSDAQRFEGMDLAICTIDIETHKMKFSSAQRPLILIRNGEIQTYKGSIYSIGEYYDNIQKIFSNQTIDLEENDTIYLFSDGYTSQFKENGEKKFNYRRFRKLLLDINFKPLKEQPLILQRTYQAWKGNSDQIDDILILGLKYERSITHQKISAKDILMR